MGILRIQQISLCIRPDIFTRNEAFVPQ